MAQRTQQEVASSEGHLQHSTRNAPHIALINAYSVRNIGDAGIVVATIRILQNLYPNCCIEVMSWYAQENKTYYEHYGVESVEAVWNVAKTDSVLQRYWKGWTAWLAVRRGRFPQTMQPLQKADLVFSVGGGYIYSSVRGPYGVGVMCALFHLWAAKQCGRKLVIGPKSIGPIRFRSEDSLLRRVLRRADCLLAREPRTHQYLTELGLTNIKDCPDIAFSLVPAVKSGLEQSIQQGSPKIGITVLDWQFARHSSTKADVDQYLARIAEACRQVQCNYPGAHVYIFPQVTVSQGSEGDSDMQVSKQLAAELGEIGTLVQMPDPGYPEEVIALYGQMDVFLGSRMHSTIFAICGYVPTVALAYQTKTVGTFEMLGLSDYVFDVQQFDADVLASRIGSIVDNLEAEKQKFIVVADDVRAETTRIMRETLQELLPAIPQDRHYTELREPEQGENAMEKAEAAKDIR